MKAYVAACVTEAQAQSDNPEGEIIVGFFYKEVEEKAKSLLLTELGLKDEQVSWVLEGAETHCYRDGVDVGCYGIEERNLKSHQLRQ